MTNLLPAVADAFALLCQSLYRHLDEADFLASKNTAWSEEDIQSARGLIPDLVTVIRGVVVLHEPPTAEHGDITCATCGVAWPCQNISTIHRLVKDPEAEFVKIVRLSEDRNGPVLRAT